MTDPKTLPLYNKLEESKVNSRNVLSAQPSWVNRRSPPRLPGRCPAGELRRAPPPLPAPRRVCAARAGAPLVALPAHLCAPAPHTRRADLRPPARIRGSGGAAGGAGGALRHPQPYEKAGRCRAPPPCLPTFLKARPRLHSHGSPGKLGAFGGRAPQADREAASQGGRADNKPPLGTLRARRVSLRSLGSRYCWRNQGGVPWKPRLVAG